MEVQRVLWELACSTDRYRVWRPYMYVSERGWAKPRRPKDGAPGTGEALEVVRESRSGGMGKEERWAGSQPNERTDGRREETKEPTPGRSRPKINMKRKGKNPSNILGGVRG
jgi:hypothetical protein